MPQIQKLPREFAIGKKDLLFSIFLKYLGSLPILSKLPLSLSAGRKDILYSMLLALGGTPNSVTKLPRIYSAGEKDLLYSIFLQPQAAGAATLTESIQAVLDAIPASLEFSANSIPGPLTFPMVSIDGAVGIHMDAAFVGADFPNATFISGAGIADFRANLLMTSLTFPVLAGIDGFMNASFNTSLINVDLSALVSPVGQLVFEGCTALASLDLPAMTGISGTLDFHNCSSLASVSVAAVISPTDGFNITFNGCALGTSSVDGILSAMAQGIGGTTIGTISLDGGTNSSPTGGAGNADFQTLVAAGINVTIN